MPNENEIQSRSITPEAEQIARAVRAWLNTYPNRPMDMVDVEFLGETEGLAITTTQTAYKVKSYILGGYLAQYQFAIVYQTIPQTANERLIADENLADFAAWVTANAKETLQLPPQCQIRKLTQNTNAALLGRYETGTEVHQVNFTLLYEVNV